MSAYAAHHEPVVESPPITPDLFRAVFRDHAARVVVVTAPGASGPVGLTATSLASVSLDPPMVSFAVAAGASAWPVMATSRRLGVHLLDHGQDWLATRFASSGVDRFAEPVRWHPGVEGEPVLEGCAAYLGCRVVQHVPAGDHVLVLARVEHADLSRSGRPLIYHDGGYASVGAAGRATPINRAR